MRFFSGIASPRYPIFFLNISFPSEIGNRKLCSASVLRSVQNAQEPPLNSQTLAKVLYRASRAAKRPATPMRDEPIWTASAALDLEVVAAVELAVPEVPAEAPVAVAEEPEPDPECDEISEGFEEWGVLGERGLYL